MATELGAVTGWQHIIHRHDRAEIAIILAVGIRKLEEFQIVKGKRAKNNITSFIRLAKIFGSNTRTIQECNSGVKYRYSKEEHGRQSEPPKKLQTPLAEEEGTSESTTDSTSTTTGGSSSASESRATSSRDSTRGETEMTT